MHFPVPDYVTRPPVKEDRVVDWLRAQVVSAAWAPGARIPPRRDLEAQLAVSSVTLQRALDRVVADGFLRAESRSGTFVADFPPHGHRFGLVFPWGAGSTMQSLFWQALQTAAEGLAATTPGTRFVAFQGVDHPSGQATFAALRDDLRAQRLAGLLFPQPPEAFVDDPVWRACAVPAVALQSSYVLPHLGCFHHADGRPGSCADRAMCRLAERGVRRVAVIGGPLLTGGDRPRLAELAAAAARHGLLFEPHWRLSGLLGCRPSTRHLLQLLLSVPRRLRPDGLYVDDDNLVEDVVASLVDLGVRVPGDLVVVGHANFPAPPRPVVPVPLVGFDIAAFVRAALRWCARTRQGDAPAPRIAATVMESDPSTSSAKGSPR